MATLTVLKFSTPDGADKGLVLMRDLQKQNLIVVQDSAIVTWPKGAKKPKTKQGASMTGIGALNGAFWGMLFGLLFFIPIFGLAVGAVLGGLAGHFADYGIDDKFVKEVRQKVTEGTSALFLLTSNAVEDRVIDAVKKNLGPVDLIASNLSKEQEDRLKVEFAEEEPVQGTGGQAQS
jgi:uncharacterized membrane protein